MGDQLTKAKGDIFQQRPSYLKADKTFDPGLLKSNIRKS
jgi:hypothetical protein